MKKFNVNEELIKKIAKKGAAFVLAGTMALGAASATTEGNIPFAVVVNAQENNELEAVQLEVQTGLNLYMDDKGFIPRDVNGNETYPFISNGTTYVPIRAISELFNADVKWNSKNNTVTITTKGSEAELTHTIREKNELKTTTITAHKGVKLYIKGEECIPQDVNGNVKDIYIVNGTTYVPVRAVSNALGLPIAWSEKTNSVFIGNHKTEGITVENINNFEEFCKIVENDFYSYNFPYVLGYIYEGEKYNIISSNLLEYKLAVALLNYEYCSDELLQSLFSECTEDDMKRMCTGTYEMIANMLDDSSTYKWDKVIIPQNLREYLSHICELCQKYANRGGRTVFIDEMVAYYSGNSGEVSYQNGSILIDHFMTDIISRTYIYDILRKEHKELFSQDLDPYNIQENTKYRLNQMASEIYTRSRSKQLKK